MSTSRRTVLLGGLAAGGAGLVGCGPRVDPAAAAELPEAVNGRITFEVEQYPALSKEGGAITARVPNLDFQLLVVHPEGERFAAMENLCTHAGCPLGFAGGQVECPCHGSRFGMDGQVLHPPAKEALQTFRTAFAGGVLTIDLAPDEDFPSVRDGQVVVFDLARFPQLSEPGGFVLGTPRGMSRPLLLIVQADGTLSALDPICTHMGCTVGWQKEAGRIECPCHGSRYSPDGQVIRGPAPRALKSYPVTRDPTSVIVTIA